MSLMRRSRACDVRMAKAPDGAKIVSGLRYVLVKEFADHRDSNPKVDIMS